MDVIEKLKAGEYLSEYTRDPSKRKELSLRNSEKNAKFKADAIEYAGLTNHPKADKAFKMAYDRSHSSGYRDVVDTLEELAELLLD